MIGQLSSHLDTLGKVPELNHLAVRGLVGEVAIESGEELRGFELKGGDDDFHIGQGDVSLTPFHTAHVAAVQAAVVRKALLREALRFSKLPHYLPEGHQHRQSLAMGGGALFHGALWFMQAGRIATDETATAGIRTVHACTANVITVIAHTGYAYHCGAWMAEKAV